MHTRHPKPLLMMHIIIAISAALLVACTSEKSTKPAPVQSEAIPVQAVKPPEVVVVAIPKAKAAAQPVAEIVTETKAEEPNAQHEKPKAAHLKAKKKKSAKVVTKEAVVEKNISAIVNFNDKLKLSAIFNSNDKLPEDTLAKLTVPEKPLIVDRQYDAYVWIGPKSKTPEIKATELSSSVIIPHPTKFAKILLTFTGKANGLKLNFVGGNCQELSPDGAHYPFTITALIKGEYKVGAQIELHNLNDCTDTLHGLPTDFKPISVEAISMIELILSKLRPVFAEKTIELLTSLFAIVVLFIIWIFKEKLFQWFGYKDEK